VRGTDGSLIVLHAWHHFQAFHDFLVFHGGSVGGEPTLPSCFLERESARLGAHP